MEDTGPRPHLTRSFGLLQATALNMSNMVGVGPFITVPLLMAAMGGPQSLLGWLVGAVIVIGDGQVWSELGAALPGSGGSYQYLREAYDPRRWGSLMAFLFIWQFVLSGPLEIASGMIGFGQYASYLWPSLTGLKQQLLAAGVGVLAVIVLARRITSLGRITVTLWVGTIITLVAVLATGLPRFDAARAFDFPPGAFGFDKGFFLGLGSAALVAVYDYLGYYDVCYIGDEVRDPGRVIPRSILYSIAAIFVAYLLLHLSLIGTLPWREMLGSQFVVSEFMERVHGRGAAVAITLMILWTAFGSVFALLLGYSRIPYAAAQKGDFFRVFARLHPKGNYPYVSLFVLGGVSIVAAFFSLDAVIKALITTRVLVQFMGQIVAVPLLRKKMAESERPYRMWLYPLPAVIAFLGWAYIFLTAGWSYVAVGVATLLLGVGAFVLRAWVGRQWPFVRAAAALAAVSLLLAGGAAAEERIRLGEGWMLQDSAALKDVPPGPDVVTPEASDNDETAPLPPRGLGAPLSTVGFAATGWTKAVVPGTVIGSLVATGAYGDPYFGKNLRRLPGATYPIGRNFAHFPIPDDSPFKRSWWYRTEFDLPPALEGRALRLHFDGLNYRADVWLNGHRVGLAKDLVGAFRRHEIDVTGTAKAGQRNALAVEVWAPEVTDLAFNWVDWNPMPPDKELGLWDAVSITASGPAVLRHPFVNTRLELPSLASARLEVSVEVWNVTGEPVAATVRGAIESVRFERAVALGPHQRTVVRFTPADTPALLFQKPRLWWPYRLGAQDRYTLGLELDAGGKRSDTAELRFGVQQMDSELTPEGHRLFKVNGRPILIRGGGWAGDMMLRHDPARLEAEMKYVRDMGLNTIRLEGKLERDVFYELADRYGILIQAGWCCCDHWEEWAKWDGEDHWVAPESLRDQALRLRTHPSVLSWSNGSDNPPPPAVERNYLSVLRDAEWNKPIVSSATAKPAASGPSGVKMNGPYDYVPPSYWLLDAKYGGAVGFDTEVTGGMGVPPIESLRAMLPADRLWPMNDDWKFHAGGQQFANIKLFSEAQDARYGPSAGAEEFARKAQAMAYEEHRAMFEAFARNKYRSTGVIQWMLNNAWPSVIWHLYDYYLRPGGGYFGAKAACRPLHVQYSYDDRSVVVVDDRQQAAAGLRVTATVLDLELKTRFTQQATVDVAADGVARALTIPELPGLSTTYFVRLELHDATGRQVDRNFYWLSTKADVMEWDKTTWYTTPTTSHGDLTALARIPRTRLAAMARALPDEADGRAAVVTVRNDGRSLAFMVRLEMKDGGGAALLPALWEDNYFSLLPGESREVRVSYPKGPGAATLDAAAWNAGATAPVR